MFTKIINHFTKRELTALSFNYIVLIKDMESTSYGSNESGKTIGGYLVQLKDPRFFLFYLHFFLDMVTVLSDLSVQLRVIDVPYLIEAAETKLLMFSVEHGSYCKPLMEELTIIPQHVKEAFAA